jgi:hypothetical protein
MQRELDELLLQEQREAVAAARKKKVEEVNTYFNAEYYEEKALLDAELEKARLLRRSRVHSVSGCPMRPRGYHVEQLKQLDDEIKVLEAARSPKLEAREDTDKSIFHAVKAGRSRLQRTNRNPISEELEQNHDRFSKYARDLQAARDAALAQEQYEAEYQAMRQKLREEVLAEVFGTKPLEDEPLVCTPADIYAEIDFLSTEFDPLSSTDTTLNEVVEFFRRKEVYWDFFLNRCSPFRHEDHCGNSTSLGTAHANYLEKEGQAIKEPVTFGRSSFSNETIPIQFVTPQSAVPGVACSDPDASASAVEPVVSMAKQKMVRVDPLLLDAKEELQLLVAQQGNIDKWRERREQRKYDLSRRREEEERLRRDTQAEVHGEVPSELSLPGPVRPLSGGGGLSRQSTTPRRFAPETPLSEPEYRMQAGELREEMKPYLQSNSMEESLTPIDNDAVDAVQRRIGRRIARITHFRSVHGE